MKNNEKKQVRKILKEEVPPLIDLMKETKISHLEVETDKIKVGLKVDLNLPQISEYRIERKPIKEIVKSHLVGIFHLSVNVEEETVIKISDYVKTGQIIGFIESMDVMQEIKSPVSGKIIEILAKESEPVEYGQGLVAIEIDRGQ